VFILSHRSDSADVYFPIGLVPAVSAPVFINHIFRPFGFYLSVAQVFLNVFKANHPLFSAALRRSSLQSFAGQARK